MYCPLTGQIRTHNETVFRKDVPSKDSVIFFPLPEHIGLKIPLRDGSTFQVIEAVQAPIPMIKYPFAYQSFGHSAIRELRDRLHLDRRLESREGFDRISLLYRISRYEILDEMRAWPLPAFWDLVGFDAPNHNEIGACNESAHRFVCLAAACGLIARKVNIGRNDPQQSLPHMCTEVWSDEHQKWVFWDAMIPYYFSDVDSGMPLNLAEIMDRNLAGRHDSLRIHSWRKRDSTEMSPDLVTIEYHNRANTTVENRWADRFFWCLVYMGNNHMDMPVNRFNFNVALLMRPPLDENLWREGGVPVRYYEHKCFIPVWDIHNLYAPQNQVEIHIADTPEGPRLALAQFTPGFDHLEVRVDGGPWRKVPPLSPLPPGTDVTLEARTVNGAGVCGKPARLVLEKSGASGERGRLAGDYKLDLGGC